MGTLYLAASAHLLGRRGAASASLADRPAARPESARLAGRCLPRLEIQHAVGVARAVQFGLLQGSPLPARQIAGRSGGRHAPLRWWLRVAEARLWRAVNEHRLYGPGPA